MGINKKYLKQIIYNNIKQLITSFINLCFPFLIIFKEGKSVWGNFVELYLYILLVSAIVLWGNRNYLLRKFSSSPKDISKDFTISLVTRFYLLLVLSLLGFFLFSIDVAFFLIVCHFGIFLSTSFEVLAIYKKEFLLNLYLEGVCFLFLVVGIIAYPFQMAAKDILVIYGSYRLLKGLVFLIRYRTFLQYDQFSFDWKVLKDTFPLFLLTLFGFLGSRIDVYIFQEFSSPKRLAEYHILNNFILFLTVMAAQILTPFTKIFYRGTENFIADIKKKIAVFGLVLFLLGIPLIGIFLYFALDINFPFFPI